MSTIKNLKTFSFASGTALVLGMASSSVLAADSNPFGMTSLSGGYQVAINEDKTGEGKCGDKEAGKAKDAEGKCCESKEAKEAKEAEGKCGGDKSESKPKVQEGKCGGAS